MIGKIPVLGFALVTAVSTSALAREPCQAQNMPAGYGYQYGPQASTPVGYGPGGYGPGGYGPGGYGPGGYGPGSYGPAGYGPAGYAPAGRSMSIEAGLRYSDLDHNGWVTLDEALAHGRFEFQHKDRNGDRVLSRHEIDWQRGRGPRGHWDGRVTRGEYQDAVRTQFARLDVNRDGVLGRYELGLEAPRRSAGWWSQR